MLRNSDFSSRASCFLMKLRTAWHKDQQLPSYPLSLPPQAKQLPWQQIPRNVKQLKTWGYSQEEEEERKKRKNEKEEKKAKTVAPYIDCYRNGLEHFMRIRSLLYPSWCPEVCFWVHPQTLGWTPMASPTGNLLQGLASASLTTSGLSPNWNKKIFFNNPHTSKSQWRNASQAATWPKEASMHPRNRIS